MKKHIGILVALLVCVMLAVAASAAETVVYLNDGGTGDGSSAASPLGNMTEAINKIANGGKVVIVDTYTCADEYREPTHKGDIIISGGNYIFTNGKYNRWFLSGPGSTTFENITFSYGEGTTALFLGQYFNMNFGEGVVTPSTGVYVVGGYQYAESIPLNDAPKYDADSHITIKSGTYHAVAGFSRGGSLEEYTGTSHITVEGGTIATLYGAAINGSYASNSEINVKGGSINNLKAAGDATRRLNGNSVINISGGTIGMLSINNVMGTATVNYTGGSIAMAEKTVEAAIAEFVTDGTATLVASPDVNVKLISLFFDKVEYTGGGAAATTATSKPAVTVEVTTATTATDVAVTADSEVTDAIEIVDTTEPEETAKTDETTVITSEETEKQAETTTAETEKVEETVATTPAATEKAPESDGGIGVGAIIGIVAAVVVVVAVVAVVIIKKKK